MNGFCDSHNSTDEDLNSKGNVPQSLVGILPNASRADRYLFWPDTFSLRSFGFSTSTWGKKLFDNLSELTLAVNANDFDIERIIPLLKAVLSKKSHYVIWDKVYSVITEFTPPRPSPIPLYFRPIFPSDVKNIPNGFNSGGLQNISVKNVSVVVWAQFKSWAWPS